MKQQTFIAIFHNKYDNNKDYDFYRFICKRLETVKSKIVESCKHEIFLKEWLKEDLVCEIEQTDPNDTDKGTVVFTCNAIDFVNEYNKKRS